MLQALPKMDLPFTPVKAKPLSPFISKLKLLLSDEKYRRAIRWSENGGAIVITDGEAFKRNVLDQSAEMFKTRNFTSFVRQLNLYGFRKVPVNGKGDPSKNMLFEHVHFKRDRPEFMHLVHRTCTSRKKKRAAGTLTTFNRESPRGVKKQLKSAENGSNRKLENSFFNESPQKEAESDEDSSEFVRSMNLPYSAANNEGERSIEEYMYRKFQEEQLAVQLLLNLRYSSMSSAPPSCDFQPPQTPYEPPCATAYPVYMYPSMPFYGQFNSMY